MLAMLFDEVVIAEAVRDELLRYHSSIPVFLQVRTVTNKEPLSVQVLLENLEEGEAVSIALAGKLRAEALLIDERRGSWASGTSPCGRSGRSGPGAESLSKSCSGSASGAQQAPRRGRPRVAAGMGEGLPPPPSGSPRKDWTIP